MANKSLFQSLLSKLVSRTDCRNEAGGRAYQFGAKHALAQYAATGCLNDTFYASAQMQLDTVLGLCQQCDPEFIARTALYARQQGYMKDMPALLCAVLSTQSPELLEAVFERVIDDAKMIRNFVQIIRSGVVGRKSLGSLPKRLVRNWIERQKIETLFTASVGNDPSLVDIIRMVHPKPGTEERKAFFGYLLGKSYDAEKLPEIVREYEAYKNTLKRGETPARLPKVPFQMLTSEPLTPYEWIQIARNASWQTTRMNLNTFTRNSVFGKAKNQVDPEKKFPPVSHWQIRRQFERQIAAEPVKPTRVGYKPRKSIFAGCALPMVKEILRQHEEEERRKEEREWQDRWQNYLRAYRKFEEKKRNFENGWQAEVARLEAARQEEIRRYLEREEERQAPVRSREKTQEPLLAEARPATLQTLAQRLRNPELIARSRVFPYQLMTAYMNAEEIPHEIREALQDAMEIATANVPAVKGKVYVFPDLSGSMWSPVSGYRGSATSKVQCVDVAALVSAAMLRKNPTAEVVPFGTDVALIDLNPRDSIMTNAKKLADYCAGGTDCSAPLRYLNGKNAIGDLVVYVSDNESWIDSGRGRQTDTVRQWDIFKKRNPSARMICIDVTPYGSTQAQERHDIINVGGFSDQVFGLVADVAAGVGENHWVRMIEKMTIGATAAGNEAPAQ